MPEKKDDQNYYLIDDELVDGGCVLSFNNADRLLQDCKRVLKTKGSLSTTIGLYIFALEEFGKYLLLVDALKESKNPCQIPKNIFKIHNKKMDRILKEIPHTLQRYEQGEPITLSSNEDGHKFTSPDGRTISRLTSTTGYYLIPGNITEPNFDVRKDCFFVDWDEKNKRWKVNVDFSEKELEELIKKLESKMWYIFWENAFERIAIKNKKN